jgi:hypothetical protein
MGAGLLVVVGLTEPLGEALLCSCSIQGVASCRRGAERQLITSGDLSSLQRCQAVELRLSRPGRTAASAQGAGVRHQIRAVPGGIRPRVRWLQGVSCGGFRRREGHDVVGGWRSTGQPPNRKKACGTWDWHRAETNKKGTRDLGIFHHASRLYRVDPVVDY